ncbi:colicin import membrane protein [Paenibacillus tianmuensis]|uniref:Colicin import membrane protein n=1 Tax=Paenibacillus tianmuensis TaxID=624147 RepID=A0A1G4SSG1_9BACL|nr:hypothetical protein [Paenibacillus tianmuensis]SCW71505.1 colicin import membrane protein [Paenibacillus tianmuensis]
MKMNKLVSVGIACAMLLGGAVSASAAQKPSQTAAKEAKAQHKQATASLQAEQLAQLQKTAAGLGIATDGKTAKELKAAIQEKRKALAEQKRADALAKRKAEAEKLGISTQGKIAQELAKEIQAKKQEQKASKLAKKQQQKASKPTKKSS